MGSGSLGHILLGTGLGIIAVSGLIVTVLFGQYHNKAFSKLALYESKVEWPKIDGLRSCCVAIAVLGCISAVAAIVAIVLSILLEGQTMILIIIGAVSAVFALACIIAEGVYTKKCIDYVKEDSYERKDHEKAIEYITGAIEDLLTFGAKRLKETYPPEDGQDEWKLLPTKEVLEHLGQSFYNKPSEQSRDRIFTYKQLWLTSSYDRQSLSWINNIFTDDYVILYKDYSDDDIIYATSFLQIKENYNDPKSVPIASLIFKPKDAKFVPKQKVCWPTNKNMSTYEDIECKMIKLREINYNRSACSSPEMNSEYIVPKQGTYYSKQDADENNVNVDYEVSHFPAMYHKISKEDYENEDFEYYYYTDSDNSFDGMSGKKYAELYQKEAIDEFKKGNEETIFLTLNKVDDFNSLISECKSYYEKCNERNDKGCQPKICKDQDDWPSKQEPDEFEELIESYLNSGGFYNIGYSEYSIMDEIQEHYPDNNKGKLAPAYKKYKEEDNVKGLKDLPKSEYFYQTLYTVALVHLIVQICGIILWAVGRFVGLHGGSDDKTQSEGEA